MILPLGLDIPMQRVPWMNWALMFITTVVSVIILLAQYGVLTETAPMEILGGWASPEYLILMPGDDFHWSQVVGCVLVHADVLHLAGNMWFMWLWGNAVNAKVGHLPFLALYVVYGAAASAAQLMFDTRGGLGASGAIMGLMGTCLVLYPRNLVNIWYWITYLRPAGTIDVPIVWVALVYIVIDLVGAWQGGSEVANFAHLGGAVAGAVITMGLVAVNAHIGADGKWGTWVADADEENLLQVLKMKS